MTEAVTAPATPEAATARLTELSADKAWSEKLLQNDPTVRSEFDGLANVIAGTSESIAAATTAQNDERNFASFAKGVRDVFPVTDEVLAQVAAGKPVSQSDKDLGVQWMRNFQTDEARVKQFLAGDTELRRQHFHASVLIASDVKDGAAAFAMSDLLKIGSNQTRNLSKEL